METCPVLEEPQSKGRHSLSSESPVSSKHTHAEEHGPSLASAILRKINPKKETNNEATEPACVKGELENGSARCCDLSGNR